MKSSHVLLTCVAAFMFSVGAPRAARADDDASSKAAPASSAPAPADDAALADQAIREAKTFLGLVRDAADDKAYEHMGADYRKEHTAEQFVKDVTALRDKAPLAKSFALSGDLAAKPKDGSAALAVLRVSPSLGSMFGGQRANGGALTLRGSIGLVQEAGKWKVAGLQFTMLRDVAGVLGKVGSIHRGDAGNRRIASSLEGKLVKVDDGASVVLSVEPAPAGQQNQTPASEHTFKVDGQTVVMIGIEGPARFPAGAVSPAAPRGASVTQIHNGALSDVKVDRQATIEPSDDGTHADSIMIKQTSDAAGPTEGL